MSWEEGKRIDELSEVEILRQLNESIELATPDLLDQLLSELPEPKGSRSSSTSSSQEVPAKKRRWRRRVTALAGVAAAVAICFGVFFQSGAVASVVEIDVNPSIELSADQKDRILSAKALNADGEKILAGMDLKRTNLDVAVNAIIGSMVKNGYFSTSGGAVLVTVINDDPAKSDELRRKIVSDINSTLAAGNLGASVFDQSVSSKTSGNGNLTEQAKHFNVSLGKMAFISNLVERDPSLSVEELTGLSIRQLEAIIVKKGIDLSGMAEYDSDDSLTENIEEIIEEGDEDLIERGNGASGTKSEKRLVDQSGSHNDDDNDDDGDDDDDDNDDDNDDDDNDNDDD